MIFHDLKPLEMRDQLFFVLGNLEKCQPKNAFGENSLQCTELILDAIMFIFGLFGFGTGK